MNSLRTGFSLSFLLLAVATAGAQTESTPPTGGRYTISHCLVTLIDEAQVPAREAGVLQSLEVREGNIVKAGQMLGQIADDKAQAQKSLATFEFRVAELQSKNDVDVKYAKSQIAVSLVDVQDAQKARRDVRNAVSDFELRRRKLQHERAVLYAEQAARDFEVAGLNAALADEKVRVADQEIARRRVEAPFAGVVAETFPNSGEWVNPGDAILRLQRLDKLRVEGFVDASEFAPHEVINRPVTISVNLARKQKAQFRTTISFVSPNVELSGEFRVWAEIANTTTPQGFYIVRPGMNAEMQIDVSGVATAVAPTRR